MSTILVVDDAPFMRHLLKQILTSEGYKVIEAVDGQDAIDLYFEAKPRLVIMDLSMPVKDGFTSSKEILSRDKEAKIIACTAFFEQGKVKSLVEAGVLDFLMKPFDKDKVTKMVTKILSQKG